MKGPDGKIRFYWVLLNGKKYVGYVGKDTTISKDKALKLAKKLNIDLEKLAQVSNLMIQDENVSARLFVGNYKKSISGKDEDLMDLFCDFFNNFSGEEFSAITRKNLENDAEVIRSTINAYGAWWKLRSLLDLENNLKYDSWHTAMMNKLSEYQEQHDTRNVGLLSTVHQSAPKWLQKVESLDRDLWLAAGRFNSAMNDLNKIPSYVEMRYLNISVANPSRIGVEMKLVTPEDDANLLYEDLRTEDNIRAEIWNFRLWLLLYQDKGRFPIGVCQYSECGNLFRKNRRDQIYCKSEHKTLAHRN